MLSLRAAQVGRDGIIVSSFKAGRMLHRWADRVVDVVLPDPHGSRGSEDATVAGTIVKVGTRSFTYTQKGIRSIPKVTSELSSRAFNLLRRHPGAYEQEKVEERQEEDSVRLQTCPNGPRQALEEDSCSHLHIRGIEEEVHQVLDVLVDTVSSKFVD
mmetsp:Transcript_4643/g.16898  ORF Transcript_4643/g.16898 Transcript_4643/m.16898 type:complete len:157 (-) Transcript_4643:160-630(-)